MSAPILVFSSHRPLTISELERFLDLHAGYVQCIMLCPLICERLQGRP